MKIIAESASNHQGSKEELMGMAQAAKEAGADYFTFQMLHLESFCVREYKGYETFKGIELSAEAWEEVFAFCKNIDLKVIPCVLDDTSFERAMAQEIDLLKIHATDINNFDLLKAINKQKSLKVILETQCATMFEIRRAIETLGKDKIEAVFTGYSNYPTEIEEQNLNALDFLKDTFHLKVGFADHSLDTTNIPLMVLSKGCEYLEKHITLSRNKRNFDWQVSLYPHEFGMMVQAIDHYRQALGEYKKHPSELEKSFRPVMYKRHVEGHDKMLRSNEGKFAIEKLLESNENASADIAVIARLKSQRLPKKVLKPLQGEPMAIKIYKRSLKAEKVGKVALCTSYHPEDVPLIEEFEKYDFKTFAGDPGSVIDRLLDFGFANQSGAVIRVTGDNPLTDPELIDKMVAIYEDNDVDYVKANNVPVGVTAELVSMKYLWKLYMEMENPMVSEYLTWFVLQDSTCKKACIDVVSKVKDFELINLSVDYQEDYDRVVALLEATQKPIEDITLKDLEENESIFERVDASKEMKLPNGRRIILAEYLQMWKDAEYKLRVPLEL